MRRVVEEEEEEGVVEGVEDQDLVARDLVVRDRVAVGHGHFQSQVLAIQNLVIPLHPIHHHLTQLHTALNLVIHHHLIRHPPIQVPTTNLRQLIQD